MSRRRTKAEDIKNPEHYFNWYIDPMFPVEYDRYIEVFGGGSWVLLGRPLDRNCMEVYNDYNSNLANLFYCVKKPYHGLLKGAGIPSR